MKNSLVNWEVVVRNILRILFGMVYRVKIRGNYQIPEQGAALLVANHLSYLDACFIQMTTKRPIRFVMDKGIFHLPLAKKFFTFMGAIPIYSYKHPEQQQASFEKIRKTMDQGEVVCIFPEGQISRTGETLKFKAGMERILRESPAPLVPISINGIWGSWFSYKGNRLFWKRPLGLRPKISINVGQAMPAHTSRTEAQHSVQELKAQGFVSNPIHQRAA